MASKLSPRAEEVKIFYDYGWCRFDQLEEYCDYQYITPEEFKIISGKDYIPKEQRNK